MSGAAFAAATQGANMKTQKIVVTAAFLLKGEHQEVGTTLEVEAGFAREMIALQKAAETGSDRAEAAKAEGRAKKAAEKAKDGQ